MSNILVHRDFGSVYTAKVVIEKDRIRTENWNRSQRFGRMELEDFTPCSKNPLLSNFFMNIGYADGLGSGVRNLYKYTKIYSGGEPVLEEGDVFRVTVPLEPVDSEAKPVDSEAKPVDLEEKPVDSEEKSADSDVESADSQEKSADSQVKSADSQVKSADSQVKSGDSEAKSGDSGMKSGDSEAKSGDSDVNLSDSWMKLSD